MTTISELYEAFGQINLREDLQILILENGTAIAELVESQLEQGKLGNDTKIAPTYANKYYSKKKYGMNPTPGYGVPDLKVTGEYYKGIGVAIRSADEYVIESDVPYALQPSITQYGDELLALSDENKQIYCNDTLGPAISDYILEKTGIV